MQDGNILQYVLGPIQLIGLIIFVVAALVPKLVQPRDTNNRRVLVWGLLGLGTVGVLGGMGLEALKLRAAPETPVPTKTEIQVTGNQVSGDNNAVGVGNSVDGPAKTANDAHGVSVGGNTITPNGNAVGAGNAADSSKRPSR